MRADLRRAYGAHRVCSGCGERRHVARFFGTSAVCIGCSGENRHLRELARDAKMAEDDAVAKLAGPCEAVLEDAFLEGGYGAAVRVAHDALKRLGLRHREALDAAGWIA